jgi:hypothetical protein
MLVQIRGKAVMHGRDEVGVGDRLRGTGSPRWFQGPKRRSPQREPAKSYIRHNHMMAASTKKTTRRSVIHSNFVALSGAGAGFQSAQASISRECDLAHSSSPGSSLSPIQEAAMTLQPHRLEFRPHRLEFIFAMVLAMAVTVLAITTWAAPSNPEFVLKGSASSPRNERRVG